ncbi:endo-1,4-beta-xylanase I precursor [Podospora fimiseda]|uniref:endo-1,4-beta-xylanase n=1 Tax=Podospora fimiseda TaxID=252190 RepID=A0AAN7BJE6_9PEZI|nr:endo-1,4-beta-xylanase I precursor [Podospora fimiseda]
MPTLTSLLLTSLTLSHSLLASPLSSDFLPRHSLQDDLPQTPNSVGHHDGYYYMWWTDGVHKATYNNLPGGKFSIIWKANTRESGGNFIGGKGWEDGKNRTIKYSGKFELTKKQYIAIYGMTQNPYNEFYILDYHGTYNPGPSTAKKLGEVTCDDGDYEIYRRGWWEGGSPPGITMPTRIYSIRKQKRIGGIVRTGCHFEAWKKLDIDIGTILFQIVAVEGYQSTGRAEILVESPP